MGLYLLSALVVLPRVQFYDWGSAGLATFYAYMSPGSRQKGNMVRGYWRALEVHTTLLFSVFCLFLMLSALHFLSLPLFIHCAFYFALSVFISVHTLCFLLCIFCHDSHKLISYCSYGSTHISLALPRFRGMR